MLPCSIASSISGLSEEHVARRYPLQAAVVQPKPGRTIDMAEIEGFASERLAGYKRPRSWEFRDELPRTESGKLLKRTLRDEHWKDRKTGV